MRLLHKLQKRGGETLTETLCAVLVISLASVLLATMLSTAANINSAALQKDTALYEALSQAEEQTGEATESVVKVTIKGEEKSFTVGLYGADGALASYDYKKGGEAVEPDTPEAPE